MTTGEGGWRLGPLPPARTGRLATGTCTGSPLGIRVRARASGTHPRKANKPCRPGRAGASSGGTRNAFSYLSLCLELLPGMRWRPLPGDPVCTRVCVRARVCGCVCLCVWDLVSGAAHLLLPAPPPPPRHKEPPPSPLPAHPSPALPPASAPPPRPPSLPASPPPHRAVLTSAEGGGLRCGSPASPRDSADPPAHRRALRVPGSGPRRPSAARRSLLPCPRASLLFLASRLQSPSCRLAAPTCPGYGACPVRRARAGLGVGRGRAGRPVAASPRGEEGAPTGSGAQPRGPGAEQPRRVVGSAKRRWVGRPGKPARGALLWGLPGGSPLHVPHAQGSGAHGMALGAEPGERGAGERHPPRIGDP